MDDAALGRIVALAERLTPTDAAALAEGCRNAPQALVRTRGAGTPVVRAACDDLLSIIDSGVSGDEVAGALAGASSMASLARHRDRVDLVWSGPDTDRASHRLTAAVLVDLIGAAREEVLIIGFAVHSEPSVATALESAVERHVDVTLVLERHEDNAGYSSHGGAPFAALPARRLAWPAELRPSPHAALHAKVLVTDRRAALVTSANITHSALYANIECGVVLHDARTARSIVEHIDALVGRGVLVDG